MDSRSPHSSGASSGSPRRLQPIDHIRVLYEGAMASMDLSTPKVIMQKKDLIDALRRKAPSRRGVGGKMTLSKSVNESALLEVGVSSGKGEIENLQECVNIHARRYNNLKSKCEKKQAEVDRLMDELAVLDKEIDSLRKMENNDTPETVRIQELRQHIKDVEAEIEGKLFRRQQLDHMTRRLQHDEVIYEGKVREMEDALDVSKKEFEEVKSLLRDLEAKKRESIVKLQNVELELSVAAKQRERVLNERRQQASNARRMEEWRKNRESKKRSGERGTSKDAGGGKDNDAEAESKTLKSGSKDEIVGNVKSQIALARDMTLEEAFAEIRQATGVTTLEEMVDKFLGQKANKESLQKEKKEAEASLKTLRAEQKQVEEKYAAMKASGIGGSELNREIYDRLDDEISAARNELRKSMEANRKLEEILVSVRLGAFGLMKRLEPFSHLVDNQEENDMPKTGNDALDALLKSEVRLNRMIDLVLAAERQTQQEESSRDRDITAVTNKRLEKWGPSQDDVVHENNIRVDSFRIRDRRSTERLAAGAKAATEDADTDEDEELSALRNSMKMKCQKKDEKVDPKKESTDSKSVAETKKAPSAPKSKSRKQSVSAAKATKTGSKKSNKSSTRRSVARRKTRSNKRRGGARRADLQ